MQQLDSNCTLHLEHRRHCALKSTFLVAASATIALLLGAAEARAEPPASDTSALAAQGLFDSGLALMDAKNYAEACPKFAESQKLAPAGGTLMNLALCREKEGRYATALLAYDAALAQAIKDKHAARQAFAREHQAAVKGKVSKLTLVPGWTTGEASPIIELDSTELAGSAVGIALPLDSGSHRVAVKLAGKKPRAYDVDLAIGEARDLRLSLPNESADEAPSETAQATGTVFGTGSLGARTQSPSEPVPRPTPPPPLPPIKQTNAAVPYLWLGGGLLLLGGAVAAAPMVANWVSYRNDCLHGRNYCRSEDGKKAGSAAQTWAWASTLLAIGGVLTWVVIPFLPKQEVTVGIGPGMGTVRGTF
jgi:tetratricopeptide (TPR) repeat protein